MTDSQITTSAPMSVFMTGATGALGREVTRQLVAGGHRVMGAVTSSDDATKVRADGGLPAYPDLYRAGELRSAIQGAQANIVLNLAPQLSNHLPQYPATWDERLNDATAALMEAAEQAGIEFVVHSSYAFADARNPDAAPVLRAIRAAERTALAGSVPACVLRFGYVYGPESDELLAVREMLRLGRSLTAGPENTHANWVSVSDAARAVIAAAQQHPAGAVFNIVDNQPASPADFINYFAESQGFAVSGGMSFLPSRGKLSKTQQAIMGLDSHADNATAREQLGWTPRFTSYRQGIDETLLTWRAHEPIIAS